jgi:hypothetical protein
VTNYPKDLQRIMVILPVDVVVQEIGDWPAYFAPKQPLHSSVFCRLSSTELDRLSDEPAVKELKG